MKQLGINFINEAFDLNHVSPLGPNLIGFEDDIKAFSGSPHRTCLVSGTSAILFTATGITAGYNILSALAGLWIVNNYQAHFVSNDLLCAATLAVAIFGFYNFRTRARCFAGDVGAVSISFILVFLTGKLILATGNPLYLMFMIVYGVDTFLTILYRLTRHENIFAAHRSHLYQILANESGISHVKVSTGYTVAQLLINLLIIAMAGQVALGYQLVVSVGIMGALVAGYFYLKGNRRRATDD